MAIENQKLMEKMDRELFLELIEPPIHLHLVNVQPPLVNALDPHFYLQLNCELIWLWRKIPEKELYYRGPQYWSQNYNVNYCY